MSKYMLIGLLFLTRVASAQTINDNNVRVRDVPFLTSNVVTMLNKGDEVKIFRRTEFSQVIDGRDAPWYFVKRGTIYGWVFGEYVSGVKDESGLLTSTYGQSYQELYGWAEVPQKDICYVDYDFKVRKFVWIFLDGRREVVDRAFLAQMKTAIAGDLAVWFAPATIRQEDGMKVYSDLVVKTPHSKIILYPEKYDMNWFSGEVGYIELTANYKYAVIDEGTWHVRGISVLDLHTFKVVAGGTQVSDFGFDGENRVEFVTGSHIVHGIQNAREYAQEHHVTRTTMSSKSVTETLGPEAQTANYVSFYFGNLEVFDAETGKVKDKGPVLFYMSYM